MRHSQRGLSMIGFLFVAGVLVVVALVGFRVLPAYIEYFSVKKVLEATLRDEPSTVPADLRKALARRISAEYIDSVYDRDLVVTREGNQLVASLSWQKILPMIGNASILLEFEATATR
jgi:Tfp pilus assembly major pilin PilA